MKSTKHCSSWKRKTAVLLTLALVASVSLPSGNARAAAEKSVSAKAVTISMEESTQVLVIGNTYDCDYELQPGTANEAVTFKSSKPAVATVNAKTGEITAKKRGTVTIVATTASGKKAWKTFYVVSKAGTTSYQATLNKMLVASNISKIVLKNSYTDKDYVIKKGDYSDKVLYVNAPLADVKNYGSFKNVNIVDVADHTWREYGQDNSFTITDNKINFVISSSANVKEINVTKEGSEVNVETRGNVDALNITAANTEVNIEASKTSVVKTLKVSAEDTKLKIKADGTFDKVVIDSKADVVIEGTTKKVVVEVTDNAKGAKIESEVPVEATVAAEATIALKKGAEGSKLEKTNENVALKVENDTKETITVGTEGSTKTEEVASETTTTPTPTPSIPSTGGDAGTPTPVVPTPTPVVPTPTPVVPTPTPVVSTATIDAVLSNDGKTATYTLPVSIKDIKTAKVTVNETISTPISVASGVYAIADTDLSRLFSLLDNQSIYRAIWEVKSTFPAIERFGHVITVNGVGMAKEVSIDGYTCNVKLDIDSDTIIVSKKGSDVTYIITKVGDTTLTITSNLKEIPVNLATLVVTY